MDDFVLRGFCQKCGMSHKFQECKNETPHCFIKPYNKCIMVWFLSAKQFRIIWVSSIYYKWAREKNIEPYSGVIKLLEEKPFLVAKILKEAGEKSKGENK